MKQRIFLNWFLLVFWMGVIFYLSSQPDLKSGLESQTDLMLRKMAHITEYGVLAFLVWHAVSDRGEKKDLRYLLIAVGFSVLYAISDEYHQLYVRGRIGSPVDVMIDSTGAFIAAALLWVKTRK